MDRELYAREQRRRRNRDTRAILALSLWAGGCYVLYLAWTASEGLPEPADAIVGTAVYLVTFFYLFAFWPILAAVDRLFRRPQDGGSATSPASSSLPTSRKPDGAASSSGAGS